MKPLLFCRTKPLLHRVMVAPLVQVRPEQALAAAEARMEVHELNVWKDNQLRLIEQPREEYR